MILNLNLIVDGSIINTLELNTENISMETEDVKSYRGYSKNLYEIGITDEIKDFCWDFSSRIISTDNQFDRLHPTWTNNGELQELIRTQRSYVGKLGEVAFLILLAKNDINAVSNDMFEIYEGQINTDAYDFETSNGQSIDVKAAFRSIHRNLVVNLQQLQNIPKEFYVGVKLNAQEDEVLKNKIINDRSITKAKIYGYAEKDYIISRPTMNLTEGECKTVLLENLMGIDRLLEKFNRN